MGLSPKSHLKFVLLLSSLWHAGLHAKECIHCLPRYVPDARTNMHVHTCKYTHTHIHTCQMNLMHEFLRTVGIDRKQLSTSVSLTFTLRPHPNHHFRLLADALGPQASCDCHAHKGSRECKSEHLHNKHFLGLMTTFLHCWYLYMQCCIL